MKIVPGTLASEASIAAVSTRLLLKLNIEGMIGMAYHYSEFFTPTVKSTWHVSNQAIGTT